ncbi:putative Succinate dehydrogenase assembly factor 4, mitochondrial [Hypsibius exemplaris]|uniref:Succinate dehydrogenase assembly factor 4, mitochondrial n=1 Tax=Hypsibius exemplaris TaxID=2072580 RepID=A0A1W0WKN9_HYPEX|nr:putative Succinate dehydrogenase assembly factor 4, mitochondrial [Hypsibius exemplaris]
MRVISCLGRIVWNFSSSTLRSERVAVRFSVFPHFETVPFSTVPPLSGAGTFSTVPPLSGAGNVPDKSTTKKRKLGVTPAGKLEDELEDDDDARHPDGEKEPLKPWPNNTNPHTGEIGGPKGPEPTRFGDWERKGRVSDF